MHLPGLWTNHGARGARECEKPMPTFIPGSHTILAHYPLAGGDVWISEDIATESRIYWQDRCCQSESDADGISYAAYIHALFGFIMQTQAGTRPDEPVLLIGCGGGSLAAMLSMADRAVEIVDVNAAAFLIARQHFGLPLWIPCHAMDGARYLQALPSTQRFGAIIVDAFHGEHVPGHLLGRAFLAHVAYRLSEAGFMAMNLLERSGQPELIARAVGIARSEIAPPGTVRVFEEAVAEDQNVILLAGAVSHFTRPDLLLPPRAMIAETRKILNRMRFRTCP
jgi:2-polyprenyl-3-methyl-5-hydroxy-6-metoxy-1,4-benzoquinol methylase